jgi:hypothetical protein
VVRNSLYGGESSLPEAQVCLCHSYGIVLVTEVAGEVLSFLDFLVARKLLSGGGWKRLANKRTSEERVPE